MGSRVGHVIATCLFTFLRLTGPIGGFLNNINLLASLWIAAFQTKKMTMPGRGGGGARMELQSLFRKTKQLIKIPFFNQILLFQLHHCKIHTACSKLSDTT